MLDSKKILQLGIGVAVGMVAYHFISKAMNRGGSTVGATGMLGIQKASPCRWINCPIKNPDTGENFMKTWCCKRNSERCCNTLFKETYK
jgi:hypothetical protein